MRVAAGGRVLRGFVGFMLLGLVAVSHPTRGAAQAPPDSPRRWDGLIERLSTPGRWDPESFANPRMSRHADLRGRQVLRVHGGGAEPAERAV